MIASVNRRASWAIIINLAVGIIVDLLNTFNRRIVQDQRKVPDLAGLFIDIRDQFCFSVSEDIILIFGSSEAGACLPKSSA